MNPLLSYAIGLACLLPLGIGPQEGGNRLVGYSGRCVGEEESLVRQEAERTAEQALLDELARFIKERSDLTLTKRSLSREYYWLQAQPGVTAGPRFKVQTKDYGIVVEAWYELRIPPQIVPEWLDRVEDMHQEWISWWFIVAGGTVVGWLVAFGAMVLLDRATLGYRRIPIVLVCLALAIGGTVAAWWQLLENRY